MAAAIGVPQEEFESAILEIASDEDIDGPQSGQKRVVPRHSRREPDQAEEAEVDGMAKPTVEAANFERTTRFRFSLQPIQPRSQSSLITETGEVQAIEQQEPGGIEACACGG